MSEDSFDSLMRAADQALGAGQLAQGISLLRQAARAGADEPRRIGRAGAALAAQGRFDDAAVCFQRAHELEPSHPPHLNNLAVCLQNTGRMEQAVAALEALIRLCPDVAVAHYNRGNVLAAMGRPADAETSFRRASELAPHLPEAHFNLGNALLAQSRLTDAIVCYRRVLELRPDSAEGHHNLGHCLHRAGDLPGARHHYERAVALAPHAGWAHNDMGMVLMDMGLTRPAIEHFRESIRVEPTPQAHSNLLHVLTYDNATTQQDLLDEARRWAALHGSPPQRLGPAPDHDRRQDRPLRVGYVSPNFRGHAVALFLEPLLREHDPARVEVTCYSDTRPIDGLTRRFMTFAKHWRDTVGWSDHRLAQQVRDDRIDILIDLTGHIAGSRLTTFALRPAPVQMTYLGYQHTTGLDVMDYRLTDAIADPPGTNDRYYTERLLRLPCFFCYQPPEGAADVSAPPVLRTGAPTFGCLAKPVKIAAPVVRAWAQLLREMPGARLHLLASGGGEHPARSALLEQGINAGRITVVQGGTYGEFLAHFADVDVALDTFPFTGHTTTCDALWMGVPVVTLAGESYASRMGASVLSHLGRPEWIARDMDDYVRRAVELASDTARLAAWRAEQRERMRASVICDGPGFAREFEAALLTAWRAWCGSKD